MREKFALIYFDNCLYQVCIWNIYDNDKTKTNIKRNVGSVSYQVWQ